MAMQTGNINIRQYLFILLRHWVLSATIFLVILAIGIAYCFLWPKVYQASALVVVQPQKIPDSIVRATVTSKIEDRLQIITQQVLSRSRLTELIERFNLYPEARGKVPPDELAESMRDRITIKISRQNYFTVSFLYSEPKKVAAVTNAVAAFYVDSNLRLREQDAVGTARFLSRELERMSNQLEEWEDKVTKFKEEHLNELPDRQEKNLVLLEQLNGQVRHYDQQTVAYRRTLAFHESQLNQITNEIQVFEMQQARDRIVHGSSGGGGGGQGGSDPEGIREEIERLQVFYTDDHPDIQRLKVHLRKAEAKAAEEEAKKRAEAAAQGEQYDAEKEGIAVELGNLEEQRQRAGEYVQELKVKLLDLQRNIDETRQQQGQVQGWIENGPNIAEALGQLTRGYDMLNKSYEEMHAKWLDANMAANLERTQRGEQFEVVDPAQVPESPYRPDVKKALPLTVALALLVAVGLSFGLNFIDTSFISVEQTERVSELPVLVVLPPLVTAREAQANRRKVMMLGLCYGLVFLFLLGLTGILITGRAQSLKNLLDRLIG